MPGGGNSNVQTGGRHNAIHHKQEENTHDTHVHVPALPLASCVILGISWGLVSLTSFVKDEITTSKASRKLGRALVRQAGTWDPFLQCLNLDKRTNLSLSNKIHRHYKGLKKKKKKTACMHSWGKLWTIRHKKTKETQLPLLKSWEQKQGTAHAPCSQHS